jgi:protein-S-isoprenylcysteine O-methyltransferase Ste14
VTAADFFARWRVRLGYPLAALALWLARPSMRSLLVGAGIGFLGLGVRAWAAGYLYKQEILTTTGPYSHTRNPLYFGSSLMALGTAVATLSWLGAALILGYFAVVYHFVMRREESELRKKHGATFDEYAAAVPLFFPNPAAGAKSGGSSTGRNFSWQQYVKNHEYEAAIGFLLLWLALVAVWRLRLP